ncbi:serine--tRNA ligase [Candidatus Wolfebacteria bacterium RBG_13_41_7]|uniref:Serine--tRNA ligase n=1 Tax=Candidatus Wolfebacteria bacterium RBG_13_41_7 TaxID=1802554 RepID=A0A1F8DL47_9BACT|nr:MAG: serine--tRNA ligase [Candidatus Wolfebacteria bacterium RBG_13_41_7]
MLDVNLIRQNPEKVKEGIKKKNYAPSLVDEFLSIDEEWRKLTEETDGLRSQQKKLSEERKIEEAKALKEKIQSLEENLRFTEEKRKQILNKFPNIPFEDVPVGKDDSENVVLKTVGDLPKWDFQPRNYIELGKNLGIIDTESASETSGSRFGYIKGGAAMLEFALIKLAMETAMKKGFVPVIPPVMIKSEMMKAMGYIDRREDQDETYFLEKDGLYLVGTSEQSIGPMHSGEIFDEKDLPKRYVGFSTCFRREAGSYGKDTKGILRVHQFDKIEMFSFCNPENSKQEHELILGIEEELMKALQLPYHVLKICTGDLGSPAAAKYDIETWVPSENKYRETHSTSNCTDFQARRLNIKYKLKTGSLKLKADYIHTLNGTAFAIGRMLISIIENYQQKDGSILVPEVLRGYVGAQKIS